VTVLFYYNLQTTNLKAGISTLLLKSPSLRRKMNSGFESISGAQSSHE